MNVTEARPNEIKHILCLANSRKLSGRCIAGREIIGQAPGPWIRPVSEREHQEISQEERQYQDGSDPAVLDIIGVPLIRPQPHLFQQENWILHPKWYWEKRGRCEWSYLQSFVEASGPLWTNHKSSHKGLNDRVPVIQANQLRTSLKLIRVRALTIEVFCPGAAFGNNTRRVQGRFEHGGTHYWLWVTDPLYERLYLAQPDGRYRLAECCLTISLSEPHEAFCYKLIAAVIERPQTEPK